MSLLKNYDLELNFQMLINENKELQKYIVNSLNDNYLNNIIDNLVFTREVEFINGIISDFIITYNDKLVGTIECKRANINVTDYVRGIGQIFQYDYFNNHSILPKKYKNLSYMNNKFYNIYAIPSDFFTTVKFNIGLFAYPKNFKLLEINKDTLFTRVISEKELSDYAKEDLDSKYILSQYYIRDNRFFEIFMLLRYLTFCNIIGKFDVNRKSIENKVLKNTNTINNGNWRNAFITASSLGFIDGKNNITKSGLDISGRGYSNFLLTMYHGYVYPFIDVLMDVLVSNMNSNNICFMSNKDIIQSINDKYGKTVLYLTDSKGRYISSWLNIMRDDFCCIEFEPRSNKRLINYDIRKIKDTELLKYFNGNSLAKHYISILQDIIRGKSK